jgi:dCTP deaminase
LKLLSPFREKYKDPNGNSAGLSVCGYDLAIAEDLVLFKGEFRLASTVERFHLPHNVAGIIHDKSTWARQGLAVQNTVAEPGWSGHLTLELSNHGPSLLMFPTGTSICQVVFHFLDEPTEAPYSGKYQNQEAGPQKAR